MTEFWNRFVRNKKSGRIVVWQMPNIPLWGWLLFSLLAKVIHTEPFHSGALELSRVLLFTWAYLEIRSGESPFRRVLGALVALPLVYGFFR